MVSDLDGEWIIKYFDESKNVAYLVRDLADWAGFARSVSKLTSAEE